MSNDPILLHANGWFGLTPANICLNMIVRNEASCIEKIIRSAHRLVDSVCILDTGSTDNTVELIVKTCEELHLTYLVWQAPFVDYSTTRNLAMRLAEKDKPEWLLLLSGDEYLQDNSYLSMFKVTEPIGEKPAGYYCNINFCGQIDYKSVRLVKADGKWSYYGVTHEVIVHSEGKRGAPSDFLIHHMKTATPDQCFVRWSKDIALLEDEWESREKTLDQAWINGQKNRTCFYLAQSYACTGQIDKAIEWYKRRVVLGGWCEEVYESKYRVGCILDQEQYTVDKWNETVLPWYIQAFQDSATTVEPRAEPLVAIARRLNRYQKYADAYIFISTALMIPYPKQSILFVDPNIYIKDRYDVHSVTCYWLQGKQTQAAGLDSLMKVLAITPKDPRILDNLESYKTRDTVV